MPFERLLRFYCIFYKLSSWTNPRRFCYSISTLLPSLTFNAGTYKNDVISPSAKHLIHLFHPRLGFCHQFLLCADRIGSDLSTFRAVVFNTEKNDKFSSDSLFFHSSFYPRYLCHPRPRVTNKLWLQGCDAYPNSSSGQKTRRKVWMPCKRAHPANVPDTAGRICLKHFHFS